MKINLKATLLTPIGLSGEVFFEDFNNSSFETDNNIVNETVLLNTSFIKGDKGDKGDRGSSAYEIALSNGFEGTESEWLDSLVIVDNTIEWQSTNW